MRRAESVAGEGFGLPFPKLPETLLAGVPGAVSDHLSGHSALSTRNHVETPEIEAGLGHIESTMDHGPGTISADGDPANVLDSASKCAIVRGVVKNRPGNVDLGLTSELIPDADEALNRAWRLWHGVAERIDRREPVF